MAHLRYNQLILLAGLFFILASQGRFELLENNNERPNSTTTTTTARLDESTSFSNKKQFNQATNSNSSIGRGNEPMTRKRKRLLRLQVTAIHVDEAEFPLSKLLFGLTLELALNEANKYLEQQQYRRAQSHNLNSNVSNSDGNSLDKVELTLSVRSANTCSRQFAGALAAEEYFTRRTRLFVVSGCDDAIRAVSLLASQWRVPMMTAAGFSADLGDKSVHKTLLRVAFSLRAAVDFLFKIMKMFQWRRVNLVVDESDTNSLALRDSVEEYLAMYRVTSGTPSSSSSSSSSSLGNFSVTLNKIVLDFRSLLALQTDNSSTVQQKLDEQHRGRPLNRQLSDDKWPNEITEQAISDTLWRCSRFSRVTIVLMGQRHLRKFMLSAYDQGMANGQYTFINMPLLATDDWKTDEETATPGERFDLNNSTIAKLTAGGTGGGGGGGSGGDASVSGQQQQQRLAMSHLVQQPAASASIIATGENEFVWRSPQPRARNVHAKQAFESLMSIYLRTPTTKAYVYFVNNLNKLAKSNYGSLPSTVAPLAGLYSKPTHNRSLASPSNSWLRTRTSLLQNTNNMTGTTNKRIKLHTNPYSASFYDCLLIYARALHESLSGLDNLTPPPTIGKHHSSNAAHNYRPVVVNRESHARISELIRDRRFENMVTGSVFINKNGDRETDLTLDDMNKMTGKFAPVILYRGDTREIERIGRIHWSSDSSVGPTGDSVDCNLLGSCAFSSVALTKSLLWLALLSGPLVVILGMFYCVHNRLKLESQLVDQWWRIHLSEIEIIRTWRKNANDGSLVDTNSAVSSLAHSSGRRTQTTSGGGSGGIGKGARLTSLVNGGGGGGCDKTEVTRATDNSAAWASSVADVCYGNITLGIFRLSKVALKPISKFHQSRKLMIELRGLKEMNHTNLCRFIGIVVDEGSLAIVSEFCPKGSLREFFHNESMVIDWTFKYSIINDIIAGLMFLHSSQLAYHGRLKSSNCLVSGRFVIKLSDYGPRTLLEQQPDSSSGCSANTNDWMKKRIWLAPEHMAAASGSRSTGSMLGDVYSFGLLLYEIITNCLPFFNMDNNEFVLPIEQLYDRLRATGPGQELGPDLSVIERIACETSTTGQGVVGQAPTTFGPLVDLMQACWQFDANKRPTLMDVNSALKKLTRGITSKKLLENLTTRMEQYTNNLESLVEAKLATLMEEKFKTEELLYQFVPKSIASRLREGQFVEPEAFECVTVFYSDIVGFTSLSSESSPMEVVDLLSNLYLCFDETLEQHDIFKVETIGDAYIVASGLPQQNDGKHVIEIAQTALELRDSLARFKIPHMPGRNLEMRVGIHSGPCVAGIVGGLNMPKYCVFGDTLTIGKFMESSGLPMKIHITEQSRQLLAGAQEFHIEPRVPKITRDGLPYQTYWLERGSDRHPGRHPAHHLRQQLE